MAEIRLNKTELKTQKNLLAQLTKYLPTLQLKKQQLQVEVEVVRTAEENFLEKIEDMRKELSEWSILLSQKLTINIFEFLQIDEVVSDIENVAGVDVPIFREVIFKEKSYSFYMTPVWFDKALAELKKLTVLREQLKVVREKLALLAEELRQTNIKVNLFEKRMIPDCKENIRKIKIFLGDQEIAAICNAKIAKDKLKKKELLQQLEVEAVS